MRLLVLSPLPGPLESALRALADEGRCTLVEGEPPEGAGPRCDAAVAEAAEARGLLAAPSPTPHRPLIVWGPPADAVAALEAGADLWVDPAEPGASLIARVSAAVRAARRSEASRVDSATGCPTEAVFQELLQREHERAVRYRRTLALVILEADPGGSSPPAGVEAAPSAGAAASLVRAHVREVDILARLRGLRFGLLCPETDGAGALALGSRLRSALAAAPWASVRRPSREARRVRVTFSVGVAALPGRGIERPVHLYGRALEALAQAHRAGGDRVVGFGAADIVWSREAPDPARL